MPEEEVILDDKLKIKCKYFKYWKTTDVKLIRNSNGWYHKLEYNSHSIYLYKVNNIKMHSNKFIIFFHGGAKKYFAANTEGKTSQWYKEIQQLMDHVHSKEELFSVRPRKNAVMVDDSPVLLKVTRDSIIVICQDNNQVKWNLTVIRRYGFNRNMFHFESGRSADTGAKEFFFECKEAKHIYKKVHMSVRNMAKRC